MEIGLKQTSFYRTYLKQELARRCEENPLYSLRAFSRALGVDAGTVSAILSGKRLPTIKLSERILDKLNLSPVERKRFLHSVVDCRKNQNLRKIGDSPVDSPVYDHPTELNIDLFKAIGDWYHYALMELTYVENFRHDVKWIASSLQISEAEAKLAIDRLLRLGLLEEHERTLVKTRKHLTTKDKHITTPALRKQHKQFLQKAIYSLENDDIKSRNFTAMTMAIDPKKIGLAKNLIEEFTHSLCELLESGEQKKVYQFTAALFPVQRDLEERL